MRGFKKYPKPPLHAPAPVRHTLFMGETGVTFTIATCYIYHVLNNALSSTDWLTVVLPSERGLSRAHKVRERYLRRKGAAVATHVQLSRLEYYYITKRKYRTIFFHFPKLSVEDVAQWRAIFESAKKALRVRGQLQVTLTKRKHQSLFNERTGLMKSATFIKSANDARLIVRNLRQFAELHNYALEPVQNYGGAQNEVDVIDAVTFIFARYRCVTIPRIPIETILARNQQEYFLNDMRNLFATLSSRRRTPFPGLVYGLNSVAEHLFPSFETCFSSGLLMCGDGIGPDNFSPCLPERTYMNEFNYCDKCMSTVISKFVQSESQVMTTSLITCICCTDNFELFSNPYHHLVTYFRPSLMTSEIKEMLIKVLLHTQDFPTFRWLDIPQQINVRIIDNQESNEFDIQHVLTIFAACTVTKTATCSFYTEVQITEAEPISYIPIQGKENFEIAHIIQFTHKGKPYYAGVLNLELISEIKFHIMDYRSLISKSAYFCKRSLNGELVSIYRPLSLYSIFYERPFIFWVSPRLFEEKLLLIFIWNLVGSLVNKMFVKALYTPPVPNPKNQRWTYHIIYQSLKYPLSGRGIQGIHNHVTKSAIAFMNRKGWLRNSSELISPWAS
ncbi:FDX-ACB domain-containing protein [Caerostris darwini]|uniref:FDX-ACB domain-containing protein n=1 Tax=Caerostris darwini TaxID=1538125 RepID=A0AAV4M9L5_9ARAC|nr:FDX-ACB domain-containing protein [Caerostris darwini]